MSSPGADEEVAGEVGPFANYVLVTKAPEVDEEKRAKLQKALFNTAKEYNCKTADDIDIPIGEDGSSAGVAIIKFEDADDAKEAAHALNGFRFSKKHTLAAVILDNASQLFESEERRLKTLAAKASRVDRSDLQDWLLDSRVRAQVLVRHSTECEVHWACPRTGTMEPYYRGERSRDQQKVWAPGKAAFSPLGSYIATVHPNGVKLWGGDKFQDKAKYQHSGAAEVLFSPDEQYIVSWDGSEALANSNSYNVFSVLTGEVLARFQTPECSPCGEGQFPHFVFSACGRYLASCTSDEVYVFETRSMKILQDYPLRVEQGIHHFAWSPSPTQPILAIWSPERENAPARLTLVNAPEKRELAQRSKIQSAATIKWHPQGLYVCLNITKLTKNGKPNGSCMEICRLFDKGCPVELLEQPSETVKDIFWEHHSSRFALMTESATSSVSLAFYELKEDKYEPLDVIRLPGKDFNHVEWGPSGKYFVAAGKPGGELVFGQLSSRGQIDLFNKEDHYMLTSVEYSPCGRYVLTKVTQDIGDSGATGYHVQMEAGFKIWTVHGRKLVDAPREQLFHVAFRPQPPSRLLPEEKAEIAKNWRGFSRDYERTDEEAKSKAKGSDRAKRSEQEAIMDEAVARTLEVYKQIESRLGRPVLAVEEPWEEETSLQKEVLSKSKDEVPNQ